jgi:probable rRNA maturation factor
MILNRQRAVRVARQPLEDFWKKIEWELGLEDADVTICLVSDAEIARMNEAFRKKRGPTDVLSFPAGKRARASAKRKKKHCAEFAESTKATKRKYLGDVAIAPRTARRYAKKNGRSLNDELRVLILHGVLHLLGYDHETDHGEMNRVEHRMRRRFGLL